MSINETTRQFILQHADDDVRRLALQFAARSDEDLDLPLALDQIRGRQVARHKLPSWAAVADIVYPPHLSMEQCSSEQTALYKAQLLARLVSSLRREVGEERRREGDEERRREVGEERRREGVLIDLTGGFGVDFAFMAKAVGRAVYVERNPVLCDLTRHNLPLLGLPEAEVVCAEAEVFLNTPPPTVETSSALRVVFLDPARRDAHGARTYALSDCTPNVLLLRQQLLCWADIVVLKLSPMLDWHRAVEELNGDADIVREVHIVSVANECKELLLVLMPQSAQASAAMRPPLRVCCANDGDYFCYSPSEEPSGPLPVAMPEPGQRLFVPNASIMKAGCFRTLCHRFALAAVGANSHLFVAAPSSADSSFVAPLSGNPLPPALPGRQFRIVAVSSMSKRDLREKLGHITQANIATRNFPMKADDLRRRLKLRDGGDTYLFATTLADGSHALLLCLRE